MPKRIHRRRTKGWTMPPNAVSVCRPGKFGNPFIVSTHFKPGTKVAGWYFAVPTVEDAVECYRLMLAERPDIVAEAKAELRGKDLACFCKAGDPCHADVLLEIANAEP